MPTNAYLLQVDPGLEERLRADPEWVAHVTLTRSVASLPLTGDERDPVGLFDGDLVDTLPGCLWAWWPRAVRREVLTRMVNEAPTTDAPHTDPRAPLSDDDLLEDEDSAATLPELAAPSGPRPARAYDAEPRGLGETLCLHRDWPVVHFLLAGEAGTTASPLSRALLGGEEIGEDLGFGPARLLLAREVASIAAELDRTGVDALVERFDREELVAAGVLNADAVGAGMVRARLEGLVAFYVRAAEGHKAVVAWLG